MKNQKAYQVLLEKVRKRNDFIAFFLAEYQKYEKLNNENLKEFLECTDEEFVRLALCRVPDLTAGDFKERIDRIASYANVPQTKIIKILRRVSALQELGKSWEGVEESYLIAARKRENDKDER